MAEQAEILRWEDPPPTRRGRGGRPADTYSSRFNAIAEQLRARPGEWAVVEERQGLSNGLSSHIRMGHIGCFTPAGDFDSVTRQGGGIARTYARYLGDGGDS